MKNKEVKGVENLIETKGFKPGEKVFSVEQMNIAVMPKKFVKVSAHKGNTKRIGMIILILGAVFLIVIFVMAYWYFFKQETSGQIKESELTDISNSEIKNIEQNEKDNKIINDFKDSSFKNEEKDKNEEEDVQKLLEKNIKEQEKIKEEENIKDNVEEKASSSPKKVVIKNVATTTPSENKSKEYKKAIDKDEDGLSDKEEALLSCSLNNSDSDQDGYDDLSEFLNLYNPSGAGALMVNAGIEKYRNGKYAYWLYYPKLWKAMETGNGESVVFNITNNNFIQIIVEENKEGLSLEKWFKKQFKKNLIKNDQTIYKRGWLGYKSEDELSVYLNRPGKNEIYIISYSVISGGTLDYKNIFQMIINSFELSK